MEPLNKPPTADDGSFPPILWFEKREIHTVFHRFSNLVLTKNLSPSTAADLIRASLNPPAAFLHTTAANAIRSAAGRFRRNFTNRRPGMPEFLPISKKDMDARGWTQCDFVYIIGDAYVDHPSFGHAIISRVLEDAGYKVGILSQ